MNKESKYSRKEEIKSLLDSAEIFPDSKLVVNINNRNHTVEVLNYNKTTEIVTMRTPGQPSFNIPLREIKNAFEMPSERYWYPDIIRNREQKGPNAGKNTKKKKRKKRRKRRKRRKRQKGSAKTQKKERIVKFERGPGFSKYKVTVQNNKTRKKRTIKFGHKDYEQFRDSTPLGYYSWKNHGTKKRKDAYFSRHSGTKKKGEAIKKEFKKSRGKYTPKILSHIYLW